MRVYHRLIHIRDQKERHEDIPNHITAHPVFKLTTDFRRHVQQKSAPISKTSPLVVDGEAMGIFGQLAAVLAEQGSVVMIYLVACILERLFGKDTVEDIEAIRGELTISDIIDGISMDAKADDRETNEIVAEDWREVVTEPQQVSHPTPFNPSSNGWLSSSFSPQSSPSTAPPTAPPVATSAFAGLVSTPNVFGTSSIFGGSVFSNLNQPPTTSVFDTQPHVGFGGLPVSNSISIVPTPVAAINSTPFSIPGGSDIINGKSTNYKTDDTSEVDETEELEPDDWQENPQPVSPPAELKPSSDGWLSSSFASPSTAPAPAAPLVTTPAFSGVPTPVVAINSTSFAIPGESDIINGKYTNNETDDIREVDETDELEPDDWQEDLQPVPRPVELKPSSDGWLSSSFTSPSTAPAPTAPLVATPAFSGVPTPVVAINSTSFAIPGESDIINGKSTNYETDDTREVDETEELEPDDWQEDPQRISPPAELKPSSDGLSSSSFTSPFTAPAPTTPLVATPAFSGLVSTPNISDIPTTQQQALTNGTKRISTTAFASGEDNSSPAQKKRVRRRISSQYHPPRTDEELAKRFKEVQSVLVACFSTTFNGPDGFSFFPFRLSFDTYIYTSLPET